MQSANTSISMHTPATHIYVYASIYIYTGSYVLFTRGVHRAHVYKDLAIVHYNS